MNRFVGKRTREQSTQIVKTNSYSLFFFFFFFFFFVCFLLLFFYKISANFKNNKKSQKGLPLEKKYKQSLVVFVLVFSDLLALR